MIILLQVQLLVRMHLSVEGAIVLHINDDWIF